jgi:hypothetical protein
MVRIATEGGDLTLPTAVYAVDRKLWPTATIHPVTGHKRQVGTTLTDAANGLWASPQARDWRSGAMTPEGHATRLEHPRGPTLPEQLDRAGLLDQGSRSTSGKRRGSLNPEEWGSPTSHERTHTPRQVDHGKQLANQVRGSLNPAWVESLMGFPTGWLAASPPDTVARRLKASAIRLSRKLRK